MSPSGRNRLPRKRLRWLRAGTTIYAIVLVPVMFATIIVGALLGSRAHSVTTCDAGYSVGGVSPLRPPSCPVSGQTVTIAVRKTISASARLACTARQAARFATLAGNEQALAPAARARRRRRPAAC